MTRSISRAGGYWVVIGIAGSALIVSLVLAGTVLSLADHLDATVTEPASDDDDRSGADKEARRRARARPTVLTRRDKLTRLDEILAALPPETTAAHASEELIALQVKNYAALHGGSPAIVSLDCRGETLCRLVLDHITRESARANLTAMRRHDELFTWNGPVTSGSAGGPTRQLLFLLDELLVFDGWDIIERKEGPGRDVRSGRSR